MSFVNENQALKTASHSPKNESTIFPKEEAYLQEIEQLWKRLEQAHIPFSKPQWLLQQLEAWHAQNGPDTYKRPLEQGYKRVQDFLAYFQPSYEGFLRRSLNGHYYSPCENNGHLALCPKAKPGYVYTGKNPCLKCKNRIMAHLEEGLIHQHLLGKKGYEGLAISPIQSDGTTSFIAIEVNDQKNQPDALQSLHALRQTLDKAHLDYLCVHDTAKDQAFVLFLFLETPLKISKAIDLAQMIVMKAIVEEGLVDFSIFDQIIPVTLPKKPGDLGRMVALPWDGCIAKEGSSLFLDEEGNPYKDQWQALETTHKLSPMQIDAFLSQAAHQNYRNFLQPTLFKPEEGYSYASSLFETVKCHFFQTKKWSRLLWFWIKTFKLMSQRSVPV